MNRTFRHVLIGLGLLSVAILASCGSGSSSEPEYTPTLTLWQLPPEFTPTTSPTATFTASPLVTETPTLPAALQAASAPFAAGWNHTCAITNEGGVMCWGDNENGQLGDGSRTDRNRAVAVKNLDAEIIALTAGWGHTCALTAAGGVKCWGRNRHGELGDGKDVRMSEPVDVVGLDSGVVAIAAGDDHTCAITAQGAVKCWGYNNFGQLGDGSYDTRNAPVEVSRLEGGVTGIVAGSAHTCASTIRGEVMCWGHNELGQLGDGSDTPSRATPGIVKGLTESIAALTGKGAHTCILTPSGVVQCWGENRYGQLGDGTVQNQFFPVVVTGLEGTVSVVAAGWNQTCGLLDGGILKCWGWNFYGQLGEGSTANRRKPVAVSGLTGKTVAVSGGGGHTCAVQEDRTVYCWGLNVDGQLGDLTNLDSTLPVKVVGITVKGTE